MPNPRSKSRFFYKRLAVLFARKKKTRKQVLQYLKEQYPNFSNKSLKEIEQILDQPSGASAKLLSKFEQNPEQLLKEILEAKEKMKRAQRERFTRPEERKKISMALKLY